MKKLENLQNKNISTNDWNNLIIEISMKIILLYKNIALKPAINPDNKESPVKK